MDSGPGIPAEERNRIFEAFYQGKTPQGGHVKGTGIGLSVVTEFVNAHGGSIEILEAQGGGAHFRVRLPLRAAGPPRRVKKPMPHKLCTRTRRMLPCCALCGCAACGDSIGQPQGAPARRSRSAQPRPEPDRAPARDDERPAPGRPGAAGGNLPVSQGCGRAVSRPPATGCAMRWPWRPRATAAPIPSPRSDSCRNCSPGLKLCCLIERLLALVRAQGSRAAADPAGREPADARRRAAR